jgi:hypothetical protein
VSLKYDFVLRSGDETNLCFVFCALLLDQSSSWPLIEILCLSVWHLLIVQHINIVSIDQELMCSIQFQFFLIFFDLPDGIFLSKVGEQWR